VSTVGFYGIEPELRKWGAQHGITQAPGESDDNLRERILELKRPEWLRRALRFPEAFDPAGSARVAAAMEDCVRAVGALLPMQQLRPQPIPREAFDMEANQRAAARFITERRDMPAPNNPYRPPMTRDEDGARMFSALSEPPVRRFDTEHGPGLTGQDLHDIAQAHHLAGYAKAEREYQDKLADATRRHADIYDEGFDAGVRSRRVGLAKDFATRLLGVHFALMVAEDGPKTKLAERLEAVRRELNAVEEFATAVGGGRDLGDVVDPPPTP
jgi:hypothetical protein